MNYKKKKKIQNPYILPHPNSSKHGYYGKVVNSHSIQPNSNGNKIVERSDNFDTNSTTKALQSSKIRTCTRKS